MVPQITVIGILMIVNGALASLLGVLIAMIGPMFLTMLNQMPQGPGPGPPRGVLEAASLVYLVLGTAVLIAGVVNIVGGIRALSFRNRGLVITALFFNIMPLFTCYCLPTSLGLMIYGLIVMFQADVAQAFALAEAGHPLEEIRDRLAPERWPARRYRDRDRDQDRDQDRDRDERREDRPPREMRPVEEAPPPPPPPREDGQDDDQFYERRP